MIHAPTSAQGYGLLPACPSSAGSLLLSILVHLQLSRTSWMQHSQLNCLLRCSSLLSPASSGKVLLHCAPLNAAPSALPFPLPVSRLRQSGLSPLLRCSRLPDFDVSIWLVWKKRSYRKVRLGFDHLRKDENFGQHSQETSIWNRRLCSHQESSEKLRANSSSCNPGSRRSRVLAQTRHTPGCPSRYLRRSTLVFRAPFSCVV